VATTAAVIIFWPAAFLVGGDKQTAAELVHDSQDTHFDCPPSLAQLSATGGREQRLFRQGCAVALQGGDQWRDGALGPCRHFSHRCPGTRRRSHRTLSRSNTAFVGVRTPRSLIMRICFPSVIISKETLASVGFSRQRPGSEAQITRLPFILHR
jgi:hypothetical protein